MEPWVVFGVGIGVIIFTLYFLEKEIGKMEIFWLYTGLAIFLGLVSVYTVASDKSSYEYYITMAVIFVLMAMFYFDEGESHAGESA